jgi:hypothetical protein
MDKQETFTVLRREQLLIERAPHSMQFQDLTVNRPGSVIVSRMQAAGSADAFDPLLLACFARYAGVICQAIYSSVG